MNKTLSATGKTISSIDQKNIKMDRQFKKVLACKPILAVILAEVVDECKGMSTEEISNCIGGVTIEEEPLFPTEIITGSSEEDYLQGEGMIRYDVKTAVMLPNKKGKQRIKLIIDVEAQKNDSPGYDIVTRGIFYCCRLISAQLDTEFTVNSKDTVKYANIKKAYSIWICTETSDYKRNTVEKYSIKKEMLYGKASIKEKKYDLFTVIIVNIGKTHDGKNTGSNMLDMLNTLTDTKMTATSKINALEKLHVHVTEQVEEVQLINVNSKM